jgi:hypothetical protein
VVPASAIDDTVVAFMGRRSGRRRPTPVFVRVALAMIDCDGDRAVRRELHAGDRQVAGRFVQQHREDVIVTRSPPM